MLDDVTRSGQANDPVLREYERLAARYDRRWSLIDDDGTEVQAMTFNGSVPGPLIVVHQGDYVELTLE